MASPRAVGLEGWLEAMAHIPLVSTTEAETNFESFRAIKILKVLGRDRPLTSKVPKSASQTAEVVLTHHLYFDAFHYFEPFVAPEE